MTQDLNRVELRGTLAEAPQSRSKPSSTDRIVTLRIATARRYRQDNELKEFTSWHRVVCFGKHADTAGFLSKGDRVALEGELQTRKYEATDGKPAYITEVVVSIQGFIAKLTGASEGESQQLRESRQDTRRDMQSSMDDDDDTPPFD